MELAGHVIGVCDWSLKCRDTNELVEALKSLKLCHVQLALGSLIQKGVPAIDETLQRFEKEQIVITAGMIGFAGEDYSSIQAIRHSGGFVPDAKWDERRKLLDQVAKCGERLRLTMVSTHIGFVPSSNEPGYQVMVERVRDVADLFKQHHLCLLFETGQESANELLQFLNDLSRTNVGVNFDPANMILYGAGNPVDAVRVLGRHVNHVHIKDAVASGQPGIRWGDEVPFGKGQVNAQAFLESLEFGGYKGPLVIEREAGAHRVADVQHAVSVLAGVLNPRPSADGE